MRFKRLVLVRPRLICAALATALALTPLSAHALSDGTPSTTGNTKFGIGFNGDTTDAVLQPDGKVIVVGNFTSYNGTAVPGIVRLNTDGSVDTGFNTRVGTGSAGDGISAIELQPDGKLVLSGTFSAWNGTPAGRIARIQPDGSTDQAFIINVGTGITGGAGSSAGAFATDIEIQPDGKIVFVGDFTQFQGATQEFILRLNADGTADTAFNTNAATVIDIYVYGVEAQSTGHLIVVGGNIGAGGSTNGGIVRLTSTGTLDSSFSAAIGTGAAAVAGGFTGAVAVLSDNSVLVGGKFSQFGTSVADSLAKISATGTVDSSFATTLSTGIAGAMARSPFQWMEQILVQSDGSLLLGGCFLTINGVSSPGIARITSSGEVDSSFGSKLGSGFNGCVRRILSMPDGTAMAFGQFTSINGVTANGIAVLGTTPASPTSTTTTIVGVTRPKLPATGSTSTLWVLFSLTLMTAGIALARKKQARN